MNGPPITGFAWRHPRCENCGREHPWRYALVEVAMIATAFFLAGFLGGWMYGALHS